MNLVKAYMEKFIWENVSEVKAYNRIIKESPKNNFLYLLGAPEIISEDKKIALIIKFKNNLPPDIIRSFLHLEYDLACCKNENTEMLIYDAAVIYSHTNENHLIVEMNAVCFETRRR